MVTRSRILSPLAERRFRLLWFGETVSFLGDRVYGTALPFLVFALGGSPEQLSLAFVFYFVPQLAFLLLGGVVVDRFPRRNAMLLTDAGHILVLGAVVMLLLTGNLRVWHVWALAAFFGAFSAFFMPASQGIIPELVPEERLVSANALYSVSQETDNVLGPALGGTLVAGGGVAAALGFDAFTFVISGLCLLGIGGVRTAQSTAVAGGLSGYWRELREGFRVVRASQWLWATILLFSLVNVFFGGAVQVALPTLSRGDFGGAAAFGWIMSGVAGGSILAALVLGRKRRLPRRGILAYAGLLANGLAFCGFGAAQNVAQAIAVGALLGASLPAFDVVWSATLQELVPREALGRVVSIDMLGSFGLLPLGYLLAGPLVANLGARTELLISGIGVTALALTGLSLRSVRELD